LSLEVKEIMEKYVRWEGLELLSAPDSWWDATHQQNIFRKKKNLFYINLLLRLIIEGVSCVCLKIILLHIPTSC
jgi:hypothetical protein